MRVDTDTVTKLIHTVAAEEVVSRFERLARGEVTEKGPGDFVTIADLQAERRLTEELTRLLPGSVAIGEEAAAADPAILGLLAQPAPVWVIDPVDGTLNFSEGRRHFGTIVALVRSERVEAAWIHDPLGDETAVAEAGAGAWIGDRRLQVARPEQPEGLRGALLAGQFGDKKLGARIQSRRQQVGAVKSLRSAAHEYLRLARGEMHYALFTKLMPWDHAAGVLIHREAGGHSSYLDGAPYRPSAISATALLLAPDLASWRRLETALLSD
ncbi:MAG TPA: inositol monophosphatase [Alphaproteobacteria bacterium]|nr:inositol monophosphatase [Alphaproteobacteria bacterium]